MTPGGGDMRKQVLPNSRRRRVVRTAQISIPMPASGKMNAIRVSGFLRRTSAEMVVKVKYTTGTHTPFHRRAAIQVARTEVFRRLSQRAWAQSSLHIQGASGDAACRSAKIRWRRRPWVPASTRAKAAPIKTKAALPTTAASGQGSVPLLILCAAINSANRPPKAKGKATTMAPAGTDLGGLGTETGNLGSMPGSVAAANSTSGLGLKSRD